MAKRLPSLPQLLQRKIYKTGQTRGADDDVIYQNRVGRNSTVLIPFSWWSKDFPLPDGEAEFEKGYIVLISPKDYKELQSKPEQWEELGLTLGENALVFYYSRAEWEELNPDDLNWEPANSRENPLGGQYVARVPATTAATDGGKINRGFNTTSMKGAGIRVFEYASSKTINDTRLQLEAVYWMCSDSSAAAEEAGMTKTEIEERKKAILDACKENDLLNLEQLVGARIINAKHQTVCPLCLEKLSAFGFFNRMLQAEGREVQDLTVTEINLFHINELRMGTYNHRPYNLGWGHHHCNVVVKDAGIHKTLEWMKEILERNK